MHRGAVLAENQVFSLAASVPKTPLFLTLKFFQIVSFNGLYMRSVDHLVLPRGVLTADGKQSFPPVTLTLRPLVPRTKSTSETTRCMLSSLRPNLSLVCGPIHFHQKRMQTTPSKEWKLTSRTKDDQESVTAKNTKTIWYVRQGHIISINISTKRGQVEQSLGWGGPGLKKKAGDDDNWADSSKTKESKVKWSTNLDSACLICSEKCTISDSYSWLRSQEVSRCRPAKKGGNKNKAKNKNVDDLTRQLPYQSWSWLRKAQTLRIPRVPVGFCYKNVYLGGIFHIPGDHFVWTANHVKRMRCVVLFYWECVVFALWHSQSCLLWLFFVCFCFISCTWSLLPGTIWFWQASREHCPQAATIECIFIFSRNKPGPKRTNLTQRDVFHLPLSCLTFQAQETCQRTTKRREGCQDLPRKQTKHTKVRDSSTQLSIFQDKMTTNSHSAC